MALNTLNTRIAMRYDTYANWSAADANPVLLKGEIAVVEVPVNTNEVSQEPAILFKIGDGNKHFNDLPYLSAVAADVYNWAKKATPDVADFPWLTSFIQGAIKDTNTTYTFARGKDAENKDTNDLVITPSEGTPITISLAPTGYVTDAQFAPVSANVTSHGNKLNEIDGKLVEIDSEIKKRLEQDDVDDRIDTKYAGWNLDKKYVSQSAYDSKLQELENKDISLQTAINTLNDGPNNPESVASKIEARISELLSAVTDDKIVNTIKETFDYIAKHGAEYQALVEHLGILDTQVGLEEGETVAGIVSDAVTDINKALYGNGGSSSDVKGGIAKDVATLKSELYGAGTADDPAPGSAMDDIDQLQSMTSGHDQQITTLIAKDAAIEERIDNYSMDDIKQGAAGYFVLSCGTAAYYNAAEKAEMESGASAANLPS